MIELNRPVWSRIVRDPFLPVASPGEGECLDLRSWTQWDGFSCGAVAGWIVVNTFHRNASWREFHEHCSPCPESGLSDSKLISSLRAFMVGVSIRRKAISFSEIKRNIGIGYPIITTIDCPGEDVAHWVVIYGYSEGKRGQKQVYLANNSFKGIHHPRLADSVMSFRRFQTLSDGHKWYVCWGR